MKIMRRNSNPAHLVPQLSSMWLPMSVSVKKVGCDAAFSLLGQEIKFRFDACP